MYPAFDVSGAQFNMSRSKADENPHGLCPVLYETLIHLKVMPHREFETPADMMKALKGIDTILIDVTERNYRRSQDDTEQREHYSGKKKTYCQEYDDDNP